jgi:hypothetical protein
MLGSVPWALVGLVLLSVGASATVAAGVVVLVVSALALLAGLVGYALDR